LWDHYRDKDGENTRAAWTAKEWLPTRDEQHAARNRRDKAKKQREDRTTPAVGERPALGRRICGGVEATMGDADGGAHGAAAGPGAADASLPPFLGFSPSGEEAAHYRTLWAHYHPCCRRAAPATRPLH